MQRIRMVTSLVAILLVSCQKADKIDFLEVGEIEPGCTQASLVEREEIAPIARDYFLREVGVPVSKLAVGRLSKCENNWIVPIIASTSQVPTSRTWYVEVKRSDLMSMKLVRPM
jgi:hypothetical protein